LHWLREVLRLIQTPTTQLRKQTGPTQWRCFAAREQSSFSCNCLCGLESQLVRSVRFGARRGEGSLTPIPPKCVVFQVSRETMSSMSVACFLSHIFIFPLRAIWIISSRQGGEDGWINQGFEITTVIFVPPENHVFVLCCHFLLLLLLIAIAFILYLVRFSIDFFSIPPNDLYAGSVYWTSSKNISLYI